MKAMSLRGYYLRGGIIIIAGARLLYEYIRALPISHHLFSPSLPIPLTHMPSFRIFTQRPYASAVKERIYPACVRVCVRRTPLSSYHPLLSSYIRRAMRLEHYLNISASRGMEIDRIWEIIVAH